MSYMDVLRSEFNGHIAFKEKRPGILQVFVPLFHEDGDMVDIFLTEPKNGQGKVRISDYGLTQMRLSYSYELDTPNKERIFQKILSENGVQESESMLFLDAERERLYPAILQFAQTIAKVSSMQYYKREMIQNLFFEQLAEFIEESLPKFNITQSLYPLHGREDLEVPFVFNIRPKPVYLFGVKDNDQARLVTISCLEFQVHQLPFTSVAVHSDFEALTKKDRIRLMNAVDKQFATLDDFKDKAESFLKHEATIATSPNHPEQN